MATHYSDDGRHWWDGATWQPVSMPVALVAGARSNDRRWWWNGVEWRPMLASSEGSALKTGAREFLATKARARPPSTIPARPKGKFWRHRSG